jgi:hypothetical protein
VWELQAQHLVVDISNQLFEIFNLFLANRKLLDRKPTIVIDKG